MSTLKRVVKQGGYVLIATFSLNGAKKCSGLDIRNYDENLLAEFLGEEFELIEHFDYMYYMPSGESRPYIYTLFQRKQKWNDFKTFQGYQETMLALANADTNLT